MPRARAHGTFSFEVAASAAETFYFVTPEGERLWEPHWNPVYVGDSELRAGTVFETNDEHGRRLWLVDSVEVDACRIRYVAIKYNWTITTVDVSVNDDGNERSRVRVTYDRLALCAQADADVEAFARGLPHMGEHWGAAVAKALATRERREM